MIRLKCQSCRVVSQNKKTTATSKTFLQYINKVNHDILEAQGPIVKEDGKYVNFDKEYLMYIEERR